MKTKNYFQIHKNKNPKRIKRIKPDVRAVKSVLAVSAGRMQNEIIKSQVGTSPILKALLLAENTIKTAQIINNIYSNKNYVQRKRNSKRNRRG